jgi:hypothetical protein
MFVGLRRSLARHDRRCRRLSAWHRVYLRRGLTPSPSDLRGVIGRCCGVWRELTRVRLRPLGAAMSSVRRRRIAHGGEDNMTPIRIRVVAIALSIAFGSVAGAGSQRSAKEQNVSGTIASSRRMADGKEWTTANLNVNASPSYCYDDAEPNCRRYGRLYTWESAQRVCQSLGGGWRLPTDDEWRQMAKHYGGVSDD